MFGQAACNFVLTNLAKLIASKMELGRKIACLLCDLRTKSVNKTVQDSEVKQGNDAVV